MEDKDLYIGMETVYGVASSNARNKYLEKATESLGRTNTLSNREAGHKAVQEFYEGRWGYHSDSNPIYINSSVLIRLPKMTRKGSLSILINQPAFCNTGDTKSLEVTCSLHI